MENIYANVSKNTVCKPSVSNPPASIKSNRGCYLCVITFTVILSVLLLAGLAILSFFYVVSVRNLSEISANKDNLTEHLNAVIERMNSSLIETTKKLMDFEQGKTGCPVEWIYFRSSCYYFSGESGSWDKARNFCKNKGADLVVINSHEEKKFISAFKKKPVWIGLSDKAEEGTWKWVDGSPLTLKFWGGRQPDNGGGEHGEEDCVQFVFEYSGIWNDASCKTSSQGLCEKRATQFV